MAKSYTCRLPRPTTATDLPSGATSNAVGPLRNSGVGIGRPARPVTASNTANPVAVIASSDLPSGVKRTTVASDDRWSAVATGFWVATSHSLRTPSVSSEASRDESAEKATAATAVAWPVRVASGWAGSARAIAGSRLRTRTRGDTRMGDLDRYTWGSASVH